jgi:uncharacterized protein YozE (UPF0346 family)
MRNFVESIYQNYRKSYSTYKVYLIRKKPKSIDEATDIAESYYLDLAEENGWRVYRIKNLILTFIEKNVAYKFDLTAKQHSDIVTVIEDQIKNMSKDQKFLVLSEEEILNLM